MKRAAKTWGGVYYQHLRRGEDHGFAAHAADIWQKKHQPELYAKMHEKRDLSEERKMTPPFLIPHEVLKEIADKYNLGHVILFASQKESDAHHVVTYGETLVQSLQAASFGNSLKILLGWPATLQALPDRFMAVLERQKKLEQVCETLMKYEYMADGDEDGTSETIYWEVVKQARELVGDYKPMEENNES